MVTWNRHRYWTAVSLIAVTTLATAAWRGPDDRSAARDPDAGAAGGTQAFSIQILNDGTNAWSPLRPSAATHAERADCTLNLSASNAGPRYIGIATENRFPQVRTAIGWWVDFVTGNYLLVPGQSKQWTAKVNLACNARRRFRFDLYQYEGQAGQSRGKLLAAYTYYYPSSSTFTDAGAVNIKLGNLSRFFK